MKAVSWCLLMMVLCACPAWAQDAMQDTPPHTAEKPSAASQAAPAAPENAAKQTVTETVDVVAVQPKQIPQGSAEAVGNIVLKSKSVRIGQPMDVGFRLTNKSSRSVGYLEPLVFLDLRDRKGKLAPQTELGCLYHPLSPCQSKAPRRPERSRKWSVVPPHTEEYSTLPISGYYDLKIPGVYWLTGYVCGLKIGPEFTVNAGPECFKTKRVKLKVQPAASHVAMLPK